MRSQHAASLSPIRGISIEITGRERKKSAKPFTGSEGGGGGDADVFLDIVRR